MHLAKRLLVYRNHTDQQLLEAIRQDDENAFAELFRRYWKKAHSLVYTKVKSSIATEDIVQDLFTTLWDKRKIFQIKNISSYINTSLKNSALNLIESRLVHEKYWIYYREFIPQSANDTENIVQYDQLLEAIESGLDGLSQKSKTAFCLNHLEGKTVPEIARQLNLSEKAIQYHITKSIKRLRIYLSEYIIPGTFAFIFNIYLFRYLLH